MNLQATRLYVVTVVDDGRELIVRAASKSRAVRLAASARIASQADLERLLAAGVKPRPPKRTEGEKHAAG